ncbi:hypothetical protein AAFN85_13430 [Mucilaginibacter sp. CAU 1740]|uniref:hypothetical protein n=1 Tax=Mucilaginibacter sp. CAU 1740 TaxID=3140365 RepID=UPI00325B9080
MATTNVLGTFYETLLCTPGMNEMVKIDVKVSRKLVLLLNSVIEGSSAKEGEVALELLKLVPPTEVGELKVFADECLNKAGLKELSEKMKTLIAR